MSTSIWRPYTQAQTAAPALRLKAARGSYLFAEDGRKLFDGISSWWLITHGHCHPTIAEAIARQAEKIDQVVFANFAHDAGEELAERLVAIAPMGLTKVFFSDNGSTAVEVALKMALQAAAQSGQARKTKFLAFSEAYHGDTVGAMSVSGRGIFTKPYERMTFEVLRASQPEQSAPAADWVKDFRRLIETHHEELAGVIVEPLVQGAAGMIVWPLEAVREIAALAKKYRVKLIFDEVMTGFGRTGELFASRKLDVAPDFLCLSKGLTGGSLPLSVTLTTQEIHDAFLAEDKARMFLHGHSFTGNAISCAAAVANLKLFDSENTLQKLHAIENAHRRGPATRVCGTIAALDLDGDRGYGAKRADWFHTEALKRDVFLRPLGNVIYLMPPYCSTAEDLDHAWGVIRDLIAREPG